VDRPSTQPGRGEAAGPVMAKKKYPQIKAGGHHVKNAKSMAASQASFRKAGTNNKVQSKFVSPG